MTLLMKYGKRFKSNSAFILPAVILLVLLAACGPALSLHRLWDIEHSVVEPLIVGTWITEDQDAALRVEEIEGSTPRAYRLTFTDDDGSTTYEGHLVRLGESLFLDFSLDDSELEKISKNQAFLPLLSLHFIARVNVQGDVLQLALLSHEELKKRLATGSLHAKHVKTRDGDVVLTAETPELQDLVRSLPADDNEIWGALAPFHRQPKEVGFYQEGQLHMRHGRPAEATQSFRNALEIWPGYADAHAGLAEALLEMGRFEEALNSIERAIQLEPANAEFYSTAGLVLTTVNEFSRARAQFQQALRLAPRNTDAQLRMALTYMVEGCLAEAAAEFARYFAIEPLLDEYALASYPLLLRQLGRQSEARAFWEQVAEPRLKRKWSKAFVEFVGTAVGSGQKANQWKEYGDWASVGHLPGMFLTGYKYLVENNIPAARAFFQRVVAADPHNSFFYLIARARLSELGAPES
jgi:tetratricopeptide (TPR) repeat protein